MNFKVMLIKLGYIFSILVLTSCAVDHGAHNKNTDQRALYDASFKTREAFPKAVDEYFLGIRSDIERRWTRPRSARNGLKVLIRISLIPGGALDYASIIESSGDPAFDQSAISAIEKVGTFVVPSDTIIFDQYFKRFTILFVPDDLAR